MGHFFVVLCFTTSHADSDTIFQYLGRDFRKIQKYEKKKKKVITQPKNLIGSTSVFRKKSLHFLM